MTASLVEIGTDYCVTHEAFRYEDANECVASELSPAPCRCVPLLYEPPAEDET